MDLKGKNQNALIEKHLDCFEETKEKHAEIIRVLWRHENDLMNVRFTWFTTIQALLFAGLGLAWQSKNSHFLGLISIICILGSIVSISTTAVFLVGRLASRKLDNWWKIHLATYEGPPITGKGPVRKFNVRHKPNRKWNGISKVLDTTKFLWEIMISALMPWYLVPFSFLAIWLLLAFNALKNNPSLMSIFELK